MKGTIVNDNAIINGKRQGTLCTSSCPTRYTYGLHSTSVKLRKSISVILLLRALKELKATPSPRWAHGSRAPAKIVRAPAKNWTVHVKKSKKTK